MANDTEEQIAAYQKDGEFNFKIARDVDAEGSFGDTQRKYGVMAFPTNYLIGKDGKILWRGIGFNEQELRQALADAGIR